MTYNAAFFEQILGESLASAKVVVPMLMKMLHPASVVDVGCATGAWLSVFREHGVQNILGLDGAYVDESKLLIPREHFRVVDLGKPFTLAERMDLAISLEVAEHLSPSSADGYVQSLCHLAPVIAFSAATPGQGGVHHVNEQWPEYWRLKFARHGFRMFDPLRPALWYDERVGSCYRQNLFVFVRDDAVASRSLPSWPELRDRNVLMLVGTAVMMSPRVTLKRLPRLVLDAFKRRFSAS